MIQISGEKGQVVVGKDEDLYSRTLRAKRLNWIAIDPRRRRTCFPLRRHRTVFSGS